MGHFISFVSRSFHAFRNLYIIFYSNRKYKPLASTPSTRCITSIACTVVMEPKWWTLLSLKWTQQAICIHSASNEKASQECAVRVRWQQNFRTQLGRKPDDGSVRSLRPISVKLVSTLNRTGRRIFSHSSVLFAYISRSANVSRSKTLK